MLSRQKILGQIRANKPPELPSPIVPFFNENEGKINAVEKFGEVLRFVGGSFYELPAGETNPNAWLVRELKRLFPAAKSVVSSLSLGMETQTITPETDTSVLEGIDLAVLYGEIAVAENAAIWLPEAQMPHRAVPFITQYLVLVVKKESFVRNMHEAYQLIPKQNQTYGVFISGPSKTADIEQSLVIGAHGARGLTVFVV